MSDEPCARDELGASRSSARLDAQLLDALDQQYMLRVAGYGYDLQEVVRLLDGWARDRRRP